MTIGAAALGQRVTVDRGDVALELGVLAGLAVDPEHRIEDHALVTRGALLRLSKRGHDEVRLGRLEVLAQLLDEPHEVFLVLAGMGSVVAVLVSLPPEEARDFVALGVGVVLAEVGENLLRPSHVSVVLHTGIPSDGHGLCALVPRVWGLLVARIDLALVLILLRARRQHVPTERAVADAALEDHDRGFRGMTHVMSDADLRADIAARDGHELVVELPHATRAAAHDAHVADILSHGPVALIIDKVGVETLLLHRVLE